jgi:hypothetical protein
MADKYYVLDADSNKINDLFFQDTTYMPLAFINNDTIVLRDVQTNDWLFFSESQNKYIKNIPKNLKALLEKIPTGIDKDEYFCRFEKSLNQMILFASTNNDSAVLDIYFYNYDKNIVEKQEINIDNLCKDCGTLNAYWISSNQILLTLILHSNAPLIYCVYNTTNRKLTKMKFFNDYYSLEDCFDNYCLIHFGDSRPYQAAIYKLDTTSMKLSPVYQIYAEIRNFNPLGRLGFVSPTKIARMTNYGDDFLSFQPYLNQITQNFYEIRIEKVEE